MYAHETRGTARTNCQSAVNERVLLEQRSILAAFRDDEHGDYRTTMPRGKDYGLRPQSHSDSTLCRCAWSLIQKWKWMRVQMLARSRLERCVVARLSLLFLHTLLATLFSLVAGDTLNKEEAWPVPPTELFRGPKWFKRATSRGYFTRANVTTFYRCLSNC